MKGQLKLKPTVAAKLSWNLKVIAWCINFICLLKCINQLLVICGFIEGMPSLSAKLVYRSFVRFKSLISGWWSTLTAVSAEANCSIIELQMCNKLHWEHATCLSVAFSVSKAEELNISDWYSCCTYLYIRRVSGA